MRFGLSGLLSAVVLYAAAGVQPRDLRCEYRDNPEGIDSPSPRLTWTLAPANPKARGLHQKAYRILVASSESALRANRGDLWDSGRVESANSVLVPYAGKPLPTGAAAFWKVQVWDQDNAPSDWSAAARSAVGLLRPDDWHGHWIGRDDPGVYKVPGSPFAGSSRARGGFWIRQRPGLRACRRPLFPARVSLSRPDAGIGARRRHLPADTIRRVSQWRARRTSIIKRRIPAGHDITHSSTRAKT